MPRVFYLIPLLQFPSRRLAILQSRPVVHFIDEPFGCILICPQRPTLPEALVLWSEGSSSFHVVPIAAVLAWVRIVYMFVAADAAVVATAVAVVVSAAVAAAVAVAVVSAAASSAAASVASAVILLEELFLEGCNLIIC